MLMSVLWSLSIRQCERLLPLGHLSASPFSLWISILKNQTIITDVSSDSQTKKKDLQSDNRAGQTGWRVCWAGINAWMQYWHVAPHVIEHVQIHADVPVLWTLCVQDVDTGSGTTVPGTVRVSCQDAVLTGWIPAAEGCGRLDHTRVSANIQRACLWTQNRNMTEK